MNGYFNVLKPPGVSSAGVISRIRSLTGSRTGHAGTLDPEAAGILPVMVGRATRLLDFFAKCDKEYIAEIAFTCSTDTQDAQGQLLKAGKGVPTLRELQDAIPGFLGLIQQAPPAYSALKRNGVPLYRLARSGVAVETERRTTRIDRIEILSVRSDSYLLHVVCGSGTYIRTLCHDLGQALGKPAHMRFLLRKRVGVFDLSAAVTLEELRDSAENRQMESFLMPCDVPLQAYPALEVPPAFQKQAGNGIAVPASFYGRLDEGQTFRMYDQRGFLGMARLCGDALRFQVIVRGIDEA